MKKPIRIILPMLVAFVWSSCATLNIKTGTEAYENMQYQESIKFLEKGLAKKEDPAARAMLAEAYLEVNDFEKANFHFDQAMNQPGVNDTVRMKYGKVLMSQQKYPQAVEIFEGILARDPGNSVAQNLLRSSNTPNNLKKDSLLFSVDSVIISDLAVQYSAVPYNNGIIVTGAKAGSGEKDPYTGLKFSGLYFVESDGEHYKAPELMSELDGKYHEGIIGISDNGEFIAVTRSNYSENKRLAKSSKDESNTQIYFSHKDTTGKWEEPMKADFNDPEYMYAHPGFSPDGKIMVFSSNMPGGFGGMDLYISRLNEEGNWGKPENLGGIINTPGNEVFPFVQSKDTLYFSSDSHLSLGGLDILYAVINNGQWNDPIHVSYPINSPADDFSMFYDPATKKGYFSSDRTGQDRIYKFDRFDPAINLNGLAEDKNASAPLDSVKIKVDNLTDGTSELLYTDANGAFSLPLVKGKDYKIEAEKEGYFKNIQSLSTKNIISDEEVELVLEMEPLIVSSGGDETSTGAGVVMPLLPGSKGIYDIPNIYWDYNTWELRSESEPYLDYIADLFKDNSNLKFEIRSHCDARGSHPYNDELSKLRAKSVTDYLIKKGVPMENLISKGMGKRDLLNGCNGTIECSEAEHQVNRRTEFIVIEKK